MIDENKASSRAAEEYFEHDIQVMRGNEQFLRKNASQTYGEVIDLINDAIDYVVLAVRKADSVQDYVRHSRSFFLHHILMPFSYAVYLDLMAGNIPACFMQLRLMLESLGKCCLADLRYPDEDFFETKLQLLEGEEARTSRVLRELGRELGSGNDFVALWGKLSHDWIHARGIMSRITDQIIEKSDVPSWGLVIPMSYAESDLDSLEELCKRISQFRRLLTAAMHGRWGPFTPSAAG